MVQLVAMDSRHQHHFLAVLLLLAAWSGSQLQANAQQHHADNICIKGYSCSDSGAKSCNTFLLYRAQEKYSTVRQIAELFNMNATVVAELNKLSAKEMLEMGKVVIIPATCRCEANSISFANNSYTIDDGDFYYNVNKNKFEFLSTQSAIEAANSKLDTRNLQIGQKIVLPLRCACPSKAQTSKGVKSLVTYPVLEGEKVDTIAPSFGVSSADIIDANTLKAVNPAIYFENTLLIPIYSSQPSYRYPNESPPPGGDPEAPLPGEAASGRRNGGGSSSNIGIIVGIIIPILAFAALMAYFVYTRVWRRNGTTQGVRLSNDDELLNRPLAPGLVAPCQPRLAGGSGVSSSRRSV